MISVESVSKWFGDHQVLRDCSLTVASGEVVVICGPSGSGKSTLLKCINGLEPVQDGAIRVDGEQVICVPGGKKGLLASLEPGALVIEMSTSGRAAARRLNPCSLSAGRPILCIASQLRRGARVGSAAFAAGAREPRSACVVEDDLPALRAFAPHERKDAVVFLGFTVGRALQVEGAGYNSVLD